MTDDWLEHIPGFLEAAGVDSGQCLQAARLGLMLSPYGEDCVVRVVVSDNRAAWCRTFTNGWACVALAPLGEGWDVDCVPRAEFFATRWPKGWLTPSAWRRAQSKAKDVAPEVNGMAWANDRAQGGIITARIVAVSPLALELEPGGGQITAGASEHAWRTLAWNVDGWRLDWQEGKNHYPNFKLGSMRAGLRMKHIRKRAAKEAGAVEPVSPQARDADGMDKVRAEAGKALRELGLKGD